MEIERKFLIHSLPENLEQYDSYDIEQGYLNKTPVVRIRKGGDAFTLTYKGSGTLAHEEYNLPLTEEAYLHLLEKCDGRIITKRRYKIPYQQYTIELDIFSGCMDGLILAEVEFESIKDADAFIAPDWFKEDVTYDYRYRNNYMAYGE